MNTLFKLSGIISGNTFGTKVTGNRCIFREAYCMRAPLIIALQNAKNTSRDNDHVMYTWSIVADSGNYHFPLLIWYNQHLTLSDRKEIPHSPRDFRWTGSCKISTMGKLCYCQLVFLWKRSYRFQISFSMGVTNLTGRRVCSARK